MKQIICLLLTFILSISIIISCRNEESKSDTTASIKSVVFEIMAIHDPETGKHLFNLSEDTVSSGWTTFRFTNASPDDHFAVLWKLPVDKGEYTDPITFDTWQSRVTIPFQKVMDNIVNPDIEGDAVFAPFGNIPDWYPDTEGYGGPGFTSAGHTSETTVNLVPGRYVMECYVKNASEEFHSYLGMMEMITVIDKPNNAEVPVGDLELTLSSSGGIFADDRIAPGQYSVSVYFEDQDVYEHMIGHDVHLVRLDGEEIQTVAEWMNWMIPGALVSPSPGTFLGGTQTMKKGDTAYVTIKLQPGTYAWISEVPAKNEMWKVFTVTTD